MRAATFAIVTISMLFIVQQLAFNLHALTNGAQGMSMPLPPFPVETYERPFYFAMVGVWIAAMLLSWAVYTGKLGLTLFSIRDDEDRARGLGVHTTYAKTVAFAVSGGLTAMAGCIWAYYDGLHLPAVRDRPAGHDRRRADGVPGRPRHRLGADPGRADPGAGAAVPGLLLGASST